MNVQYNKVSFIEEKVILKVDQQLYSQPIAQLSKVSFIAENWKNWINSGVAIQ